MTVAPLVQRCPKFNTVRVRFAADRLNALVDAPCGLIHPAETARIGLRRVDKQRILRTKTAQNAIRRVDKRSASTDAALADGNRSRLVTEVGDCAEAGAGSAADLTSGEPICRSCRAHPYSRLNVYTAIDV